MFLSKIIFLTALVAASAASSEPLANMAGTWKGSGWARETQQGQQETVRCQITNSYDRSALTLTLSGKCVVPGRQLAISGTLTGSQRRTGWPD